MKNQLGRRLVQWSFCVLAGALIAGCSASGEGEPSKGGNKGPDSAGKPLHSSVQKAAARVHSLQGNRIQGRVVFTRVADGVQIVADVEGLSPGGHGFHVHEFGICSDNGSSAGGHFNPTHRRHGGPDSPERHVGDLGNLFADETGYAHYERVDTVISLEGEHSIVGRSIIIHADPDDFVTQPTGASGSRIACGIIEAE